MGKRLLVNLLMVLMTLGLVFTVSCSKTKVSTDPTMQSGGTDTGTTGTATVETGKTVEPSGKTESAIDESALEETRKKEAAKRRFASQDIHFEYDSSELSPMAQLLLKEKAAWLEENPNVTVVVEGHCDERGTTEYNLALGERRAVSAQQFLIDLGISASRLTTISYGEERPLDPGHDETAWAKNRRAHFNID